MGNTVKILTGIWMLEQLKGTIGVNGDVHVTTLR